MSWLLRAPRRKSNVVDTMTLSEFALNKILKKIQIRFDWPSRAPRFHLVSRKRIRGGILYRCRPDASEQGDVVLKQRLRWTPDTAQELYRAAVRIRRYWPGNGGVESVSALGWAADPPLVCFQYIDGQDVDELVLGSDLGSSEADLRSLVIRCGEALGGFHRSFAPDVSGQRLARAQARGDLDKVARRMLIPARLVKAATGSMAVSFAYEDFRLGNMRLGPNGELFLLDPPSRLRYTPVYRDLSIFAYSLRGLLSRSHEDGAAQADVLLEDFYRAYAITGPTTISSAERWLVGLYWGHKVLARVHELGRRGDYVGTVRPAWRWAKMRRHLRRSVPSRLVDRARDYEG
jgi:hypothetical protein